MSTSALLAAIEDARRYGAGLVLVTFDDDGEMTARRLDPEQTAIVSTEGFQLAPGARPVDVALELVDHWSTIEAPGRPGVTITGLQ